MTKKRSKCLFVVFAIILVVALVACFVNFTYPLTINGNYYSYSSFVSNLKLGEDISSSLKITYLTKGTEKENYSSLLNSTMLDLKKIVQDEGYTDVTVSTYGEDSIVMNIGNILTKQDKDNIIDLVGSPASISFSLTQDPEQAIITRSDIESVETIDHYDQTTSSHVYYVNVKFKDSKKAEIADLTKNGGSIYIYFGKDLFTTMNMGTEGITDGYIFINSPEFTTLSVAKTYTNKIKTGMLALELTNTGSNDMITASYGDGANILLSIAIAVALLAGFIYLIVKYKQIGWLACFNLLFLLVLGLFLLQSIPFVTINFAGLIALALSFVIAIDCLIAIFEKAKKHFNADTKLHIALNLSLKENLGRILLSNIVFAILGLICVFIPSASIKSMGWVLFVMSLVTLFTTLVLMRLFIKMYLAINNEDGKKCNFHKGGKNA